MKSRRLTLYLLVIICSILALSGCKKESDNPIVPNNHPPFINLIIATPDTIQTIQELQLSCIASDFDDDNLIYSWTCPFGSFPDGNDGSRVVWRSSTVEGEYQAKVVVFDGTESAKDSVLIVVGDSFFANQPPTTPENIFPGDNMFAVPTSAVFSWSCSDPEDDTLTYDLYYGVVTDTLILISDINETSFDPDTLEHYSAYSWQVVAKDNQGNETTSPNWAFTTVDFSYPSTPDNPVPANDSLDVSTTTTLSWSFENPDNIQTTFDLYFGSEADLQVDPIGLDTTSYSPDTLEYNTTYYWKVVARNDQNQETSGPIWSFTTQDVLDPDPGTEQEFQLGSSGLMTTMVWIPAGTFMMGARQNETDAMADETPRHQVTISEGFWMGKYEVTQQEWEEVVTTWTFFFDGNPNRPAEMVSHTDINHYFINNVNSTETGSPWRLPSEAEWEYACRAGHDDTRFWWGNDPGYTQINEYAWHWDNDDTGNGHETHDVGQKLANPWGLHDMNGNVWEWCEDHYHFDYIDAPTDGGVWSGSSTDGRVARGGGWGEYGAPFCRSAARGRDSEVNGYSIFGFRLVREAD